MTVMCCQVTAPPPPQVRAQLSHSSPEVDMSQLQLSDQSAYSLPGHPGQSQTEVLCVFSLFTFSSPCLRFLLFPLPLPPTSSLFPQPPPSSSNLLPLLPTSSRLSPIGTVATPWKWKTGLWHHTVLPPYACVHSPCTHTIINLSHFLLLTSCVLVPRTSPPSSFWLLMYACQNGESIS